MSNDQALLVAAIDFGTTFSGYAFSFRHEFENDPLKVCASSWTTGSRVAISLKTSSCVLFRPDGQFDSFGFEAEDRYSDLTLDGDHHSWFYFRRFKMMLYDSKDVHRTTTINDETGKKMLAMYVFAAAIRYLKDHMMQACAEKMYGSMVDMKEIRWVLTVPAIWDDAAKQFMREAALNADIPGDNLILALEPEAASMFCKHLPVERLVGSSTKQITCFQPNSKYLVLDAGGGTIDITVHEVLPGNNLRELQKASGGAWGGTTVDNAFLSFIEKITGPKVIAKFQEEHQDDFMDLLREFEIKKRTVQPVMDSKITFKIPIALHELFREVENGEIREAVRNIKGLSGKVTFAGDKMRVEAEVVKSLFAATNESIVNHIVSLLKSPLAKGTSAILMVGGFSESPMLRHAVETAFPSMRVIIPHEAGLAVLKGAVIFGHNRNEIISRISKYTYGFKMYKMFDPQKHPPERMIIGKKGEKKVKGAFAKLIEAGQSVSPGIPSEAISCVPSSGNDFTLKLYATSNKNPKFVDEEDCFSLGEVNVSCLDENNKLGSASVRMVFGGTELEVQAILETTGRQTSAMLNFLD